MAVFKHCLYLSFSLSDTFYEFRWLKVSLFITKWSHQTVEKGVYYTNNGFGIQLKTGYPLFSLIAQDDLSEMLEGFLNHYREWNTFAPEMAIAR